ncbi:MAG: L,D-transpeptidase family protein [Roseburia sp.]|nr:L,D-transpeptidase family protein [Roseburia sp.]
MEDTKEKVGKKKIIISLLVVLTVSVIAFFVVFYIWKMNFYQTHFLPNTYVNGVACSELDAASVAEILKEDVSEYALTVLGRNEHGEQTELGIIAAKDMGLKRKDDLAEVQELLEQQDESGWLRAVLSKQEHNLSVVHVTEFDEDALKKCVMQWDAFDEASMIAPVDAYISEYKEELKGCAIIPEVSGTQLDVDMAISSIEALILSGGDCIDLVEQNCYLSPSVLATDEKLIATWEKLNKWLGTSVTYDWNTFEVIVDGSVIESWIIIEDGKPVLDEEAVAAFVAKNASEYDTYGKSHKFITTLGVELTLPTGGFGWKTDREAVTQELISYIMEGTVTETKPIYSNTAPRHGMDDIGNSYVEADLSNQHLYLYHNGELVFETDFVSGAMNSTPDCISPAGIFDITYKTANQVLRGADYEQFVYYWMPFYGNYGMHDATWRWQFGGEIFKTDGSHGCLNLPLDSAAVIYNYIYTGYPVICYYY